MDSKAKEIEAACKKYSDLANASRCAVIVGGRYRTADEMAAILAARTDLEMLLIGASFARCYVDQNGRRLESGTAWSGRAGHVRFSESGAHCAEGATFTPRAIILATAKRNAIRSRVTSDMRHY